MSNEKETFDNKYRIASSRATWHDYSGGIYFITICTRDRKHYFGNISETENNNLVMNMSRVGKFLDYNLKNVQQHYPYVAIPLHVVMPNHIHAIVIIDGAKLPHNLHRTRPIDGSIPLMKQVSDRRGTLSVVISGIKRATTHYARQHNIDFGWQPRFYDHIIRGQEELNSIAQYIKGNVGKWYSDRYNE